MTDENLMKLPTLNVDQAAQLLGVSRGHAYAAVKAGEIPSLKLGRRVLVPTRPLLEMLGLVEPAPKRGELTVWAEHTSEELVERLERSRAILDDVIREMKASD
jgi:excisionase family DNA binding protein